jgi:hypothetical protein
MSNLPVPVVVAIITALITSLIGPTILEWIKLKFLQKNNRDVLGESIIKDEKVDLQIEQLMEELGCDRICISQFHNGGNFYPTGKSIKKFSIFYERTTTNALSIKEIFQNIPVSLFPKVFAVLYKEGEIAVPDTNNNKNDCGLFQDVGKEYNTKSFYLLAIHDLNGNFIGVLAISYYENKYQLTLDDWILVRQKIGAIGSILTDYLHDKKIKSN